MTTKNIPELFGSMVFNDTVMKERLPKDIYKKLRKAIDSNTTLSLEVANVVANAMKDWAIEKGATHFTHWFQPMTGITAEKHDSFISPTANGEVIMEFSGKELIKGEPDASSFPSGGLRATFEARGYTAWDPSSYAFLKDGTLCIPTVFLSYGGEVLDKKTPLLRSMQALSDQAIRILRLFGNTEAQRVITTVGPEQEYFLIDKSQYKDRLDLILTGRTLLGADAPKGQELEDHYFGNIKARVSSFMKELDEELWKLGILAKTKHNEVAPAQHELAPIFSTTNVANDHNQLTMEMMRKIAEKHDLVCLLHEKPFKGINGSGKHNNWSISTDLGENLLDPTDTPEKNIQFITFLCAVIKAVDEYSDLLRIAVADAGNDHRLGANEAPPAIISMFLGDELFDIIEAVEKGVDIRHKDKITMDLGVNVVPNFLKDTTDRNRTSPFAFTGNKFEFRSLGSTNNIACPNVMLNTIVAEALCQFADELESADNFDVALSTLLKKTIKEHKRVIFNGNNYSDEWVAEAEKRGLFNLKSTVDALPHYCDDKNVALFEKHKVYTKAEMESRYEISLENYSKVINIEALTLLDMLKKQVMPAVITYMKELSDTINSKISAGIEIPADLEKALLTKLSTLANNLYASTEKLMDLVAKADGINDELELAQYHRNEIIVAMDAARKYADELELLVGKKYWPIPTYSDLLFY